MSAVIALRGQESVKSVYGERKRVVPFVGTDREGRYSEMGVGYRLPDEDFAVTIWGLAVPHFLMRSWYAMKLFERLEYINSDTLCACWYVVDRRMLNGIDNRYFQQLAPQFGGSREFWAIRNEVLALVPYIGDIETAIRIFEEKGIEIDARELHSELLIRGHRLNGFIVEFIDKALEAEDRRAAQQQVILPDPPKKGFIERLRSMF